MLKSCVGVVVLVLLAAAPAQAQLPVVTVDATTSVLPNFGSHRGVTVSAECASGSRLVGGGGYLRNATDPAILPTNGLVLGGTLPSTGAAPVDAAAADGAVDVSDWAGIANFTGVSEAGDQAATFALCATGGPAHTVVATKSTTGVNATQEVNPPTITTATCPPGSRLIGGGAATRTADQVNDGTTVGNNGNLKPVASYPSNAAGVAAADGSTGATSWSAYGSAGLTSATDEVTAFALCSTDATTPPVRVARVDQVGPDAQPGTTLLAAPVSCPATTRLIGGGYKVEESVAATDGLQPQQGYHMRGTYPTADAAGTTEAADGAANLNTWTSLLQAGGQNLSTGKHMTLRGFALCAEAPAPEPDLALTLSADPAPAVVGQPLTYTLTLANAGADATGVLLRDTLPDGAMFVSADHPGCQATTPERVDCALGALAAGASVTVKLVVLPTRAGDLVNTAQATLDGVDATPGDNAAVATTQVLASPRAKPSLGVVAGGSGRAGEPITARATLTSPGAAPSGSVTFRVFGPADTQCANPLAVSSASVAGGGEYASAPFVPADPGSYRWTAAYAGDGGNEPAATACGDASVLVKAVPAVTLAAGAGGATATLSGGSALGGTLTFTVFADAMCAAPVASFAVGVAGNGSYGSPAFTAPGPGTYRWVATYGGDDRNVAAGPTDCASAAFDVAAPVVFPAPAPRISNRFTVRSKKAGRTGVVTLKLSAPGAGRFVASARAGGATFGRVTLSKRAKGALTLTLKPTTKAKRALLRHTRVKVSLTVTFTPAGGPPLTRKLSVTIKRS